MLLLIRTQVGDEFRTVDQSVVASQYTLVKFVPLVCSGEFINFETALQEKETSKLKLSSLSELYLFCLLLLFLNK